MPARGLRAPIRKRQTTLPEVSLEKPTESVKRTPSEVPFVNPPLDPNRDPQLGPIKIVEKDTTKKIRECGELQEKYHIKDNKDLWNKALVRRSKDTLK